MKPAIVSIATNDFDLIWSSCIVSHRCYAERYNFENHSITENPWPDLHPQWAKLQYTAQLLMAGQDVLLIDADAFVREHTPDFRQMLQKHPSKDIFVTLGRSNRINSGVMILRGGAMSQATNLLKACLDNKDVEIPKEDFVTEHGENGHIIHFCKKEQFREKFHLLEKRWNVTQPPVSFEDYVVHFTGPIANGSNTLDGTAPFLNTTSFGTRRARAYLSRRHLILRLMRRSRLACHVVNLSGRVLLRAQRFTVPQRGVGPQNNLWKMEAALKLIERPTLDLVHCLLRPGDTVIDGGAHIGYLSRVFRQCVGEKGQVLAIEAHPENARLLRNNTKGLHVNIVEAALTDSASRIQLFEGGGHSNHSIYHDVASGERVLNVAGRTLDEILSEKGLFKIALFKLDVEGAELKALEGAEALLGGEDLQAILMEINPKALKESGQKVTDLVKLLSKHGYTLRQIRDDYRLGMINFIDRTSTQNYLCAKPEGWTWIADRLDLPESII